MMSQTIEDVMTPNPITVSDSATLVDASEVMREADIGALIVMHDDLVRGILTDRDIVVRAVADGHNPSEVTVGQICSADITAVAPGDDVQRAVDLMREQALRRLPVVDRGTPVGIVSIGDLAIEREPMSALAEISDAPPNT
jgi:CBS domain-containing protein